MPVTVALQSSVEAYLFLFGAPSVCYAGLALAKMRFERFDDEISLSSPFMVRYHPAWRRVRSTGHVVVVRYCAFT